MLTAFVKKRNENDDTNISQFKVVKTESSFSHWSIYSESVLFWHSCQFMLSLSRQSIFFFGFLVVKADKENLKYKDPEPTLSVQWHISWWAEVSSSADILSQNVRKFVKVGVSPDCLHLLGIQCLTCPVDLLTHCIPMAPFCACDFVTWCTTGCTCSVWTGVSCICMFQSLAFSLTLGFRIGSAFGLE